MPIDFQLPDNPPAQVQPPSAPSFDDQYAKARALANGGQPELALAAYSALLTRSPGNADVLLGRGIVFARLGRWNEAVADLSAAAGASPDYADVWEALGNTYRWSEQPAKALDAYERLVTLRPQDPAALVARARAQRALGHVPEARTDLERARALGGDAAEIDGLLADLQPRPALPSAGTPDATGAAGYAYFTADFVTNNGYGTGLAATTLATWPFDGQTDVPINFLSDSEEPDPVPDVNEVGYPISVHTNLTRELTVQSFTVRPRSGGANLPTRLLVKAQDANTTSSSVAAIIPLGPLATNTRYDVSFSGTIDGTAVSRTWSFTTAR